MKIKKFTAPTEQAAIELVKEELGLDALVINIKKIQPRGIFSFFKKPSVEVMAAYDDKSGADAGADSGVKVATLDSQEARDFKDAVALAQSPAAGL
ncbi:MAG: flagellar biosynthesis protein FlhF, partial [Clostridiales bacterium]|nr:flagellar biosynthesis protein FlhF [Clostridiales bacterium]